MQTFPNSTERSSDFNSTSNLVLTKSIPPAMALYLAKNGKCLVSYEFHCSKHVQGIYKVWRVFDPRPGPSGQVSVMAWHCIRALRSGRDGPITAEYWTLTDQWEASMTLPTQAWLAIAPGPALSQARPAFLSPAQYIKYFFQPSPYILANKSLDIFTNKLRPETKFKIRRWGY